MKRGAYITGLLLAAMFLRRIDAIVRRDIANDGFGQIVHEGELEAAVAVDVEVCESRQQQGEHGDAEGVVGDRFARLRRDAAAQPAGALDLFQVGGAIVRGDEAIERSVHARHITTIAAPG